MVVDQHVSRLDVSVQNALTVGVIYRVGKVAQDSGGGRRIQTVMVAIPSEGSAAY
jgi:hypothetical protein